MTRDAAALGEVKGHKAAAWLSGGRLHDVLIDPPVGTPRVDTLFRAVATRPAPGLGGQFLKLPGGQSAYLRGGTIEEGQSALVQVRAYAEPGKAVPVTPKLRLRGRTIVATWDDQPVNFAKGLSAECRARLGAALEARFPGLRGLILRSAAETAEGAEVLEEVEGALAVRSRAAASKVPELICDGPTAQEIARRDWPVSAQNSFDDLDLEEPIARLFQPHEPLKNGHAFVEPCRAFVAIDANTGGDVKPNAGLHTNIALSRDLPRILRCRGLGGQIVIDFAPLAKRLRGQVEGALTTALKDDPIKADLLGWTSLGHFEMRRALTRYPLHWI